MMITHGWSPTGTRNYMDLAQLTCEALENYNCLIFDWTEGKILQPWHLASLDKAPHHAAPVSLLTGNLYKAHPDLI